MSASRKRVCCGQHCHSETRKPKIKKSDAIITKSRIEHIRHLSKEILVSKKQCNNILELYKIAETEDNEDVQLALIRAIYKIFHQFMVNCSLQELAAEVDHSESSDVKLRQWLRQQYKHSVSLLTSWLSHPSGNVRELSLCTLMKYVEAEGKHPMAASAKCSFPISLFENIVKSLLESEDDQSELINRYQEFLVYDDVRFNYMKNILQVIKHQNQLECHVGDVTQEIKQNNILSALLTLSLPERSGKLTNFLVPVESVVSSVTSVKVQRSLYSELWMAFVKIQLSGSMYKKILVALPDKIIPHLEDPLVLADWISSLYDYGGAVSLMALNGLFVLMNSYNLEYPDFYSKLYNTMGDEIYAAKYKARFFHLLDIFMQSLLLPTYIIAAFIKKLSRMALTAPPDAVLLIVELVINLLIRHNTCRTLIHRDQPASLDNDPYLPDETDLNKCKATESSLWEIKSLQKHWFHRIASQARRIEKPLPSVESSLDTLLETSFEELVEKETKVPKKAKSEDESDTVPVNHLPPKSILEWETSEHNSLWVIEELQLQD